MDTVKTRQKRIKFKIRTHQTNYSKPQKRIQRINNYLMIQNPTYPVYRILRNAYLLFLH